jgi:riboflavin kinase/FMN adenylyltransferase
LATVLTIGTFDGVHIGHQTLARRARALADAANSSGRPTEAVALVFDPNPLEVLRPDAAPARLSTFEARERALREAGVHRVVRLTPTPDLLGLSPAEFVSRLVAEYAPIGIVEGRDFRFGHRRAGDVWTLSELGDAHGYSVEIVEPVTAVLSDHSIVTVSSTMVRWLVRHGRVRDAAILLGRPYMLPGQVVRGDRRGRGLGFPTANLSTPCLLPADGVYAGRARVPGGGTYAAAIHVGERATFGDRMRTVEAFLMPEGEPLATVAADAWAPLPGLPEYGWTMELDIIAWLRDQIRFESVDALVDQMRRDCERTLEIVSEAGAEVSA